MDSSTGNGGIEIAKPSQALVGRIGADGHERAAAERDLTAIADKNVYADSGECEDQERQQNGS